MENNLLNVFSPKRDILFEAAMSATEAIKALLSVKKGSFEAMTVNEALFHKVFQNDPASPSIYFMDKSQYLIFYPPNSKPYTHRYEDKCKYIEVLSGVLYDANSDKKLFKGDRVKISPDDNYIPYTESEKCVIRVCVGDCNSLFNDICA